MRATAAQGTLGMGASLASAWFTVSGFETGIRIAGGLVTLAIGGFTLFLMIQRWRAGKDAG